MLVHPGRVGRIASGDQAATSGFVVERIAVLNRNGREYGVQLGAYNRNGQFVACMRWAENKDNVHFLLTPNYTPGKMTVVGLHGSYTLNEPVEVPNAQGAHFYIDKVVISANRVQYQVIK